MTGSDSVMVVVEMRFLRSAVFSSADDDIQGRILRRECVEMSVEATLGDHREPPELYYRRLHRNKRTPLILSEVGITAHDKSTSPLLFVCSIFGLVSVANRYYRGLKHTDHTGMKKCKFGLC